MVLVKVEICEGFHLDCSYLYGASWNVKKEDLEAAENKITRAADAVEQIRKCGMGPRAGETVRFPKLPYILDERVLITDREIQAMDALEARCLRDVDAVVSVGIGGSYLGNQTLFDVCCGPYWNMESREERGGWPKCFFAGHTADPEALSGLLGQLRREAVKKAGVYTVAVLVISKSGTTVEPSGALSVLEKELPAFCRPIWAAVTDPQKGLLLERCKEEGWLHFSVPEGIGGRFSVFSQVGLVFAAMLGINRKAFLLGARRVEESSRHREWQKNPALMLAAMKHIATNEYGMTAEVTMPYCERLRSLSWWYAQLLGESLGKKETVEGKCIYSGRIPVSAVGTTDMHSLTQEQQEGKRNKLIQFIAVEQPETDLDFELDEKGKRCTVPMSHVTKAALSANAEALASEKRMSCSLSIRRLDPFYLGALMYFFFLTISYEGAMAGIDAYDQPGVETYKKLLHRDLASFAE